MQHGHPYDVTSSSAQHTRYAGRTHDDTLAPHARGSRQRVGCHASGHRPVATPVPPVFPGHIWQCGKGAGAVDAVLRVTISVGVAEAGVACADITTLLAQADAAMYHAKANGRNRVHGRTP